MTRTEALALPNGAAVKVELYGKPGEHVTGYVVGKRHTNGGATIILELRLRGYFARSYYPHERVTRI